MHATSRNKVFAAVAAVAVLAGYGLWEGLAEEPSQDGSSSQSASVRAVDSPTEEARSKKPGADGSKAASGDRSSEDDSSTEPSTEPSTDPTKDPTTDPTTDPSTDPTTDPSPDAEKHDEPDDGSEGHDEHDASVVGTGETVETEPVATEAPVPLDNVGDFGTGLTVRLSDVTSVEAEAKAPGEIAGPAVQVTVKAVNEGNAPVSLDGVVVFLSYGEDRAPASEFGSSADPLTGELAPGESLVGSYVYAVPPDSRGDVRVEISYTGSAPTVAFEGSVDG